MPEAPLPSSAPAQAQHATPGSGLEIRIFESEIDPFEFSLLDSGHCVLFRKVWREGQRHIQGAGIDKTALLKGLIKTPFRDPVLSPISRLGIAFAEALGIFAFLVALLLMFAV